jgi:hypothetical protein
MRPATVFWPAERRIPTTFLLLIPRPFSNLVRIDYEPERPCSTQNDQICG